MRGGSLVQLMRSGLILAVTAFGVATPSAGQQAGPVTYSKDIAPIFQAKCQSCHQPNSIAPMSLISYKEARPWARSIKDRVMRRQMPPWHIDQSVGVQHFKNDMSLSDAQIESIVRWSMPALLRATPAICRRRRSSSPRTSGRAWSTVSVSRIW